ncbi:MAG: triose-phosphate isomerase [Bacteroidota bacterium]
MRPKLIAGNWKMNKDIAETESLIRDLLSRLGQVKNTIGVVLCPPFTSLLTASALIKNTRVKLGAQNMSEQEDGAFTGEISSRMLIAAGCEYVILGHSERRQYFKESDSLINKKVKKALQAGLKPIVCVGELLQERESGVTEKTVSTQVKGVLAGLTQPDMANVVIAYEPVWAIGTGKTATPEQANEVHHLIRSLVKKLFSAQVAENVIIQYGGSVNAANAAQLLSQKDIDGALVGGASLKADAFVAIVLAG